MSQSITAFVKKSVYLTMGKNLIIERYKTSVFQEHIYKQQFVCHTCLFLDLRGVAQKYVEGKRACLRILRGIKKLWVIIFRNLIKSDVANY
jgi:hypothetical protein